MPVPSLGSVAPNFELPLDDNRHFRLSDHLGRWVVIFFYPQDDTEGCTLENQEFSALLPDFEKLGATVLGISPDTVEKHCAFRQKYALTAPLASDPEHKAIDAYGLWQLKKMFAVEFMGVKRATVIVDPQGKVAQVIYATRIRNHAAKVLDLLKQLVARAETPAR